MGSLVHSGECGKATGVSEVSFHLDLVADNCICGSRRLMLCFLVRRTTVYCCSQVYFLLLQKEHKLARTCTTTSFFQDFLVARTQLGSNSVDCVPLLFRCSVQEGSCCCNSTAITCKVSARASEFCCACFDCRHKGEEELIFLNEYAVRAPRTCSIYVHTSIIYTSKKYTRGTCLQNK